MKFHLWMPDLFQFKGGIQVYSAYLLNALQNLHPQSQFDVFLKHDVTTSPQVPYLPQTQFHFTGQVPLKLRTPVFAAQLMGQGLLQCPDLIISTHINFAEAAYYLKRMTGVPFWAIAHGIEAWHIKNLGVRRALHHADRVLAVSNFTRDRLLKNYQFDPDQVQLLPNTFDISRFRIAPKPAYLLERYGLQPNQPVILTVNRLSRDEAYKGYDQVLAAMPQMRQVFSDIHYIIAGKGDDRPRIEQLIQQLQLQDCVTLAGFVPDQELCDHYNLCDVFAMPSKMEGFGIVYLEALACGKPVLGGNQDGAIDALCHGKLGALVNPDSVDEIAQTLIQILQGTYSNHLMYQPEILRQAVIDIYGCDRFQQTLEDHLIQQLPLL